MYIYICIYIFVDGLQLPQSYTEPLRGDIFTFTFSQKFLVLIRSISKG